MRQDSILLAFGSYPWICEHDARVAALCDLGAPGWEEPWFPHCAFVASWLTDCCMALCCLMFALFYIAIPILEVIQCNHLFVHLLLSMNWSADHQPCCCCVWLCCLLFWCFCFGLFLAFCVCLLYCGDSFPLVALFCFAFGFRGWFHLAYSLLASSLPALPAPSVCPLVPSGPVSALCRRYRNLRNLLGSASRTSSLTH